ncbi:sirohydrochlorin chelatase [Streptomyces sp. NPDC048507]|uniref:sirohydrochlorin chelatase n=1 Tax=Streptomyces sp. NPDC048507 TaxID=3365560 RepID=UPI00371721A3
MTGSLLLVAHGSRDPRHARTVRALARRIRATRPALRVATAFLGFDAPGVPEELARTARDGIRAVVVQPLLLTRAFHAKTDLPGVLRQAPPGLTVLRAPVLGPDPLLTAALERRLYGAGLVRGERASTAVVLAAAGSGDPEAAEGLAALARHWQRTAGWYAVRPAAASAGPRTEDVVRALRAEGARRVAVAPYVLAPGRLPDRIAAGARAAGADVLAPVLGAAPELVRLVLRRYDRAARVPVPTG